MEFWSKGLGKMTIALTLTKGETLKSGGTLCLRGNMEEPVPWEYVMKLADDDLVDFFGLLKEPAIADFLYDSPHRWQLYRSMLAGGIRLGVLVVTEVLRKFLGRAQADEDVVIEVPPSMERKREKGAVRRRLGSKTTAPPRANAEAEAMESSEARSAERA